MTIFTEPGVLLAGLSMHSVIVEAWKKRVVGWFYAGLLCIAAFAILFWILPRFMPKKVTKKIRYVRITLGALGLGLLLLLMSLLSGIGFGFGLGAATQEPASDWATGIRTRSRHTPARARSISP